MVLQLMGGDGIYTILEAPVNLYLRLELVQLSCMLYASLSSMAVSSPVWIS